MLKIMNGAILLVGLTGNAVAGTYAAVPAPDIGSGITGMLLAAGAVYLIKRR